MASSYEPMSGQAWRDELQSFLPHVLDCVDPTCLRPLCVNLKLTLKHVEHCQRGDQCTICKGMKALAATHSNSCRDYFCRVPFCMEAKVITQQMTLIDELVKTTDPGLDNQQEDDGPPTKETAQDDASRKVTDTSCMAVADRSKATPSLVDGKKVPSGHTHTTEQIPSSHTIWSTTSYPQSGSKLTTLGPLSLDPVQAEWIQREPAFRSRVEPPQTSLQDRVPASGETSIPSQWCVQIQSTTATEDSVKSYSQLGAKRKLQNFLSSTLPSKVQKSSLLTNVLRPVANESNSRKDDGPEVEIVESTSSGRLFCKANCTAGIAKGDKNQQKRSSLPFLSRTPSRHAAMKQARTSSTTMPESPRPVHIMKRNSLSKTSSLKPSAGFQIPNDPGKTWYAMRDSSPAIQVEEQIPDDSVVDEMFWTPPSSPMFEMSLGETVKTNKSSALKTVLLETLFQLLGIVTQPKTEQQETVFVGLLERTLRVMKTEIAK